MHTKLSSGQLLSLILANATACINNIIMLPHYHPYYKSMHPVHDILLCSCFQLVMILYLLLFL
ncbi:hypothetical protein WG66_006083 [Moniliophthora roreri]|nr:hypothetical protein WG66_006083 [Moniliophthora roreri]